MRSSSRSIAVWLLWGLAGCGSPGETASIPDDVSADTCLNCNQPIEAPRLLKWSATPRVEAMPEQLMFYASDASPQGMAPQQVLVTNTTGDAIYITNLTIVDALDRVGGAGGAGYFSVESAGGKLPIEPEEGVALTVTFLGSTEQRTAELQISTTDLSYSKLKVRLSGKYFIYSGF